ncbi:MAG TPA: hypothetical protein VG146_14760 [Verrucomicrobiae bacterium]|nr:hypothetical protein [Verrucomicrobiae bacterium]
MSLINDALKRAKQAQQQGPSGELTALQLRPVEALSSAPRPLSPVLPIAVVVLVLLAFVLVWMASRPAGLLASKPQIAPLRKAVIETPGSPAGVSSTRMPAASAPVTSASVPLTRADMGFAPKPGLDNMTATVPAPTPLAGSASASAQTAIAQAGSNLTSQAQAPPKPALLKLQGITYNPRHPSAVINGKTLFIGERLGEFRVKAIGPDSATLVSGGHATVLVLEP